MARPGPQKINRHGLEFKLRAVRMSEQPGVLVKDVAESLCIPRRWIEGTPAGAFLVVFRVREQGNGLARPGVVSVSVQRPLLIIWDGLKAYRSKLVRENLDSTEGEIQVAFVPPYSPARRRGQLCTDVKPAELYLSNPIPCSDGSGHLS